MIEKSTSVQTIIRLLLREVRREQGRNHAEVSQLLGKNSVAWNKVESGDGELSLDHLLTVCHVCGIHAWAVLQAARDYSELLNKHNWYVAWHGSALAKADDLLSKEAELYYDFLSKNPNESYRVNRWRVLDAPRLDQGRDALLGVFRWVTDGYWKAELLAPRPQVEPMPLIPPALAERFSKLEENS